MKHRRSRERLRLPQRISLVFFFCVMLPVASMVTFSELHLRGELESQSVQRLRQQAKNLSISVYERLLLLETEMRLFAAPDSRSPDAAHQAPAWDDKLMQLQGGLPLGGQQRVQPAVRCRALHPGRKEHRGGHQHA
jgi:hypothetical protein